MRARRASPLRWAAVFDGTAAYGRTAGRALRARWRAEFRWAREVWRIGEVRRRARVGKTGWAWRPRKGERP